MVLWEIALGTAYFLGMKRTHRLALRIQGRVISPSTPGFVNLFTVMGSVAMLIPTIRAVDFGVKRGDVKILEKHKY
ncbi:hypothetical protein CUMW_179990 [Citrus unshiu]|uniref:Uncharacterized protein n=1 Tax=Citrus unshiu TaxID=55188 RepID=A0A2H5PYQ3_CITUN|nr:hypothetical protein CUMW_179990 [Citrus unshiu]